MVPTDQNNAFLMILTHWGVKYNLFNAFRRVPVEGFVCLPQGCASPVKFGGHSQEGLSCFSTPFDDSNYHIHVKIVATASIEK